MCEIDLNLYKPFYVSESDQNTVTHPHSQKTARPYKLVASLLKPFERTLVMKFNESFSATRTIQWQSMSLWFLVAAAVGAVVWTLAVQPSSAQPVPTRIAFIDVQRVLGQSTAGRAATAKIKQLQESRMSRAKVLDEELRKLTADLAAAGVTPARRAQLEGQISDKRIAMQRFAEDADKELGTTRARELLALEKIGRA